MKWFKDNLAQAITWVLGAIVGAALAGATWAVAADDVQDVQEDVADVKLDILDHRLRIRALEQLAPAVKATQQDVRDIRTHLMGPRSHK